VLPNFFIVLAGIFCAAVIAWMRGRQGAPKLTEPHCGKCGYDLRRYATEPPTRCSECGSDLTVSGAVQWGELSRPSGGMVRSLALSVVVAIALIALLDTLRFPSRVVIPPAPFVMPPPAPPLSNQALLASLSKSPRPSLIWQEMQRREQAGAFGSLETTAAINFLITDLTAHPGSQPETWALFFAASAVNTGAVAKEQYVRLAQSFYKAANLNMVTKVPEGRRLYFKLEYGGPWHLPGIVLVKALRSVTLADGMAVQAIAIRDLSRGQGPSALDSLSSSDQQNIEGYLKLDLKPGRYVANFVIDAGDCVPPNHVLSLIGNPGNGNPGQAAHWPGSMRGSWTENVAVPFEVVPAGQSTVTLVTDPALDPGKAGKIVVKTLRAIRQKSGQRIEVGLWMDGRPVSLCFDVVARVMGKEYPLWNVSAGGAIDGASGGFNLTSLPSDVRSVDFIFRPDATRAEGHVGMDRIWGGTVELLNQPLQRYDMQVQSPTTQ
jgi:hypothetical protein